MSAYSDFIPATRGVIFGFRSEHYCVRRRCTPPVCRGTMVTMTAPVLPGAEPFSHDVPAAGRQAEPERAASRSEPVPSVGVLLCHGFTGSPQSLRPWAEHLAAAGFGVRLPRLPGHGTDWHDMQVTTWDDW